MSRARGLTPLVVVGVGGFLCCTKTTGKVIEAAIEVHRELGPGLVESVYEDCLCDELRERGVAFGRQIPLCVTYKGRILDSHYRLDLLVENVVVVELKAVETVLPVHLAQLLTYLRQGAYRVGLLLNFHAATLKDGLTRIVL